MSRRNGALFAILLLASVLRPYVLAQQVGPFGKGDLGNPANISAVTKYETAPGTGVLVLQVFAEKRGVPLKGNVQLQLTNLANNIGLIQSISGDQEGIFANVQPGNYEIEIGSFGYISIFQNVQVIATSHREPIEIVLHQDPTAINLDMADAVISAKAQREAKRAVSSLKSGDLSKAQKHLETAYQLAPSSSDLNFLLGYLYFQKQNYTQAGTFLSTAVSLSPNSGRALNLLGRTELQMANYPAARSALERAVLVDADNWSSHDLLADSYFHEKRYEKARAEAQLAVTKGEKLGKNTTSPAQLVLGQSLLALGRVQEAIEAFQTFLRDSPDNPLAPQVSALVAQLEKQKSNPVSKTAAGISQLDTSHADPLAAMPGPELLTTQTWRPPDIDDAKPNLTSGIPCDTSHVVEESGKKVLEFVQNLARFAADEDVFHQSLDAFGIPTHTETRKYDYTASVSPNTYSAVSIDEYRSGRISQEGYPDGISSTGFITLALVFHPELAKDFEFNCEGQGDWHGQPSWIVHFRQRSDRPNRMHTYSLGSKNGSVFPVDLKGRAWITAANFEIVQIEADIVRPVPEIQLLSERQTVEYGPVPFASRNITLWLPKKVEIYFDFRKHRYYRRHTFDHYMLFSVDAEQKEKAPANKPPIADGSDEKTTPSN
jgi:tetratricopeptide (TPR) repeat protein